MPVSKCSTIQTSPPSLLVCVLRSLIHKLELNHTLQVGHGVLTTASYEARKFGVRSGMPGKLLGLAFVQLRSDIHQHLSQRNFVRNSSSYPITFIGTVRCQGRLWQFFDVTTPTCVPLVVMKATLSKGSPSSFIQCTYDIGLQHHFVLRRALPISGGVCFGGQACCTRGNQVDRQRWNCAQQG